MSWAHCYRPASGIPASGVSYGRSIWGGAKGAATHRGPRKSVTGGPVKTTLISEERRARREKMLKVWEDIAYNSTNEFARIVAAEKWLDREEGKPAQSIHVRKITSLFDLTDEELASIRQEVIAADRK